MQMNRDAGRLAVGWKDRSDFGRHRQPRRKDAVRAGTIPPSSARTGAGKSTLMKTLYGAPPTRRGAPSPSTGTCGASKSPRDAIAAGIGMVLPALHAGRQPHRAGRTSCSGREPIGHGIDRSDRAPARIAKLSGPYGTRRRPRRRSSPTSASGQRQRVEILKVLYRGARIIILDEPTAVLVPHEVDELFAIAAATSPSRRATVVFISTSSTRCCRWPTPSP